MKRTSSPEADSPDDMLPEYQFDYRQARPNRFASAEAKQARTVVLDEDVAAVFTSSEAVNKALRALLEALPLVAGKKRSPRK